MPYGTALIDTISSSGNLSVTGNVTTSGTITSSTGTTYPIVSGTSQATTSGTSIDFTGIPSWVKRITVMFKGVSTSGSSNKLIQIGSGSVQNTGYISTGAAVGNGAATQATNSTAGFLMLSNSSGDTISGTMTILSFGSNIYIASYTTKDVTTYVSAGAGDVTLSGVLDRVRITTVNGTDTFTAGSINILYE